MRRVALAVAILLAGPAAANAFPTGDQFDEDALDNDGASGIAFTGAPRWAGHACDVCHTDAPHQIGLELQGAPVDIFTSGYEPGLTYQLRVKIDNEWAAREAFAAGDNCGFGTSPYVRCDDNGFGLEIDDANGKPVGTLSARDANDLCVGPASPQADVRVLDDKTAIHHNGIHHGVIAWDFCWKAPAPGTGPLTVYLSAVDGNGGDGTEANPQDAKNDDVFSGSVPLAELGGAPPPPQTGGCNAGGDASIGVIALLGIALVARRRRAAAGVLVALGLGGCAHVRAHEREILADKKMVFAPDPGEDELDLHMQEAREGSAGGYGSAGGGCGCN